jgi:AcrR family transcriptional regulator
MEQRTIHEGPGFKRGRRDKEQRKAALIEAATEAFARHGYDAATTREIAERAGCAEGLIHRYFGGKHGLLLAIIGDKARGLMTDFAAGPPGCPAVAEEIARILGWHLEVMWEWRDFLRVSVSRATIDPSVGHAVGLNLNAHRMQVTTERLRHHQECGNIRPDVDLEALTYAITGLGFYLGFVCQVVFGLDREHLRRVASDVAAILSRGVSPGTAGP